MRPALLREPHFENETPSTREALATFSTRMRPALKREPHFDDEPLSTREALANFRNKYARRLGGNNILRTGPLDPRNSCNVFKTSARGAEERTAHCKGDALHP
eukprot:8678757-Pyramimonas_sp.AAC.2